MTNVAKAKTENRVVKPVPESRKSAVIVGHKYLPSIRSQLRNARQFGIDARITVEGDVSAVWIDDVSRVRSNSWETRMPARQDLLKGLDRFGGQDHVVFFETPLCVGFSRSLAELAIKRIQGSGASFFVRNLGRSCREGRVFGPGSRLDLFWQQHKLQLKAAQVRISRRNVATTRVVA